MTKIPIWLDCDPGHDDAIALLLALFHPDFDLIGISTTYGNASVTNTTHNTLSILTTFNKLHVPVYIGADSPLVKKPAYAPDIHGSTGLDGTDELLPPTISAVGEPGDLVSMGSALWKSIQEHKGELSIVAIGPLTNISVFFKQYPDAKLLVKRLSIMGGGFDGVYNRGSSEFNIWCDPHAAEKIFSDKILSTKTILVPLNVTHTVICDDNIQERILNEPNTTKIRKMLFELMTFFKDSYKRSQHFQKGPPVHDPIAVYALLEEYELDSIGAEFKRLKINCSVKGEEEGLFTYSESADGVKVVFKINVVHFWDTLLNCITLSDTISAK